MFSPHSPPLLARALVSLVPIHHLRRIFGLIVIPQVFSPANVVFSGIGVLLLVSIVCDRSVLEIVTIIFLRRLKM